MSAPTPPPSPGSTAALGGIGVIILTGVAAAFGMGANVQMEAIDWALLALVLVLTIGGGLALARFTRRNPGKIGEARFDTSHADDPTPRH